LAGSTERLLGYARGKGLSEAQRAAYAREGDVAGPEESVQILAAGAVEAFHWAVDELRATSESTLLDPIEIGAARLPSTVLGALFHAAEHAQRHVGQFVTTVKVLKAWAS
jgi:hypothetical protein